MRSTLSSHRHRLPSLSRGNSLGKREAGSWPASYDSLAGIVELDVSAGEFHHQCVVAIRQSQSERIRILSRLRDIGDVRLVGVSARAVDLARPFDVAKSAVHDDVC